MIVEASRGLAFKRTTEGAFENLLVQDDEGFVRITRSMTSASTARWKWCLGTSLAMMLLSMIPQFHLWVVRGRDWNGAYVSPQGDEPLYSAYVNALIDGRPRKNDPFGAIDNSPTTPLLESFFSIQFMPAYAVALPARMLGVSASTAFICLTAIAAALASLSVFSLLCRVTEDHRLASAGTLFVLCLGALAAGHGLVGVLFKTDLSIPGFPFLRRYEPAVCFPLFFVFQSLVLAAIARRSSRARIIVSLVAGLTLLILVFSYLYLWTAAAAWLICLCALWFYFRPADRKKTLEVLITVGITTAIGLVPYAYLLLNRATTLDQKVLSVTHRPDLLHVPEILAALILGALVKLTLRQKNKWTEPGVLYAVSLSVLPLIVFNQQVLTGRIMQAYHFDAFVANYSTLAAFVVTASVWRPNIPRRLLFGVALLSLIIGLIEITVPSRLAYVPAAVVKDRMVPVLRRLKQLSKQDGTDEQLNAIGQASISVFSPNVGLIALLPSWTSQGTLLDISGVYCGTATPQDQKEFFHLHLYYSGLQGEDLRKQLMARDQFAVATLFSHERLFPALTSNFRPLQPDEIEDEIRAYETYVNLFSRDEALRRRIAYAVIPAEGIFDFRNLDRWYERDAGERVGDYMLYRLKLRN
jgi:hypothetical protein